MIRPGLEILTLLFALALTSGCREASATKPNRTPAELEAPIRRPAGDPLSAIAADTQSPRAMAEKSVCGGGMVLVEGDYCPNVRLNCKRYLDPPGRYEYFRCAEYGPSTCLSKARRHMRFCIDRNEYSMPYESLPQNHRSWTQGDRICRRLGKRLCLESEWNFACEGQDMRPYPYGFARDENACNADRDDILTDAGALRDLRAPSGSYERCVSPFGVADMTGNLEEFVTIDGTRPSLPAMKGSYWQPGRNYCRAAQTAHDRYYNGTETGFRCCSDAE